MKIYNSLKEYKEIAKIGDLIALQGNGYIDGLNVTSKADCYKVTSLESNSGFVRFKKYRGKTSFTVAQEQKIGVIDVKTYKSLPNY